LNGFQLRTSSFSGSQVPALSRDAPAFKLLLNDACMVMYENAAGGALRGSIADCQLVQDGILSRGLLAALQRAQSLALTVLREVDSTGSAAPNGVAAASWSALQSLYDPFLLTAFSTLERNQVETYNTAQEAINESHTILTVCCVLVYAAVTYFLYLPRIAGLGATLAASRSLVLILTPHAAGVDGGTGEIQNIVRRVTSQFAAEQSWVAKAQQRGSMCGLAGQSVGEAGMQRLAMHVAAAGNSFPID
jgi:hypothetical protein